MCPWWHRNVNNGWRTILKWWKIFRAKIMKSGWKIFFTKGFNNSPGTVLGLSWDRLDRFYEILLIFFWFVALNTFGILRAKMMKCGWGIYFIVGLYNTRESFFELRVNFYVVLVIRQPEVLCFGHKKNIINFWSHAFIDM